MIRQSHRAFLILARAFLILAIATTGLLPRPLIGQQRDFIFHDVRPGVYLAVGTGRTEVGANAAIIVNEHEVLLVDSHITPAAARALLRELGEITSKPVRYVVNTHFHFDHAHGNQIYPHDVEIIGHEFTREVIAGGGSTSGRGWDRYVATLPTAVDSLRREIERATDTGRRTELERRLAVQEAYLAAIPEVRPVPPTTTLATRMTLHRGDREIRLLFFGRGHTGGDVVVHLPREGVLITGDLLPGDGLPWMGDGHLLEWAETLEHLKGLEFDVILPGHGAPFANRSRIDHFQAYLRDFWNRAAALYAQGVSAENAAARIDMRDHAANYPGIQSSGVDRDAVARVYELLSQPR